MQYARDRPARAEARPESRGPIRLLVNLQDGEQFFVRRAVSSILMSAGRSRCSIRLEIRRLAPHGLCHSHAYHFDRHTDGR
jgi:hypothetical protein